MKLLKFLISRTVTFLLIIFIGVSVVFFLPRLMPTDPVETVLSKVLVESASIDPAAIAEMREILTQNFGLEGTLWEQYTGFFGRVLFTQNFGPSLSQYPTPVIDLIGKALPWTMGLMLISMIIAWIIGNIIGLLAGFRKEKLSSKILEAVSIFIYPMPYYIFALILIMLFAYIIPIFPLTTVVMGTPWSWEYIINLLYSSLLPALSLILINIGWWVLSMKTLASGIKEEDYVTFANLKGLSKRKIMWNYIAPNAILPQITALALRLGTLFSGAMIVEVLFSYPGMGLLIYNAVVQADYNLIVGSITVSILAVSIAAYVIDLIYPLLDPRIRYN